VRLGDGSGVATVAAMGAWWGGTTAAHRRRPRRSKLKLGRAYTTQNELNALANVWRGRRWRSGHGDGARGGAPVRAYAMRWLTKHGQRAREEAVDRWGTSGGVVGVEKQ